MNKQSLARALSAAVTTALVVSGLVLGATTAGARAEAGTPERKGPLECLTSLSLAQCITVDSALIGTGVAGEPLTVVEPVFGLLSPVQQGVVTTDVTWLCDGTPIPGVGDVLQYVPTGSEVGCEISVETVSSLLGFLPLNLVTNLVTIIGEDEEPPLPGSLSEVLTAAPLLQGTGAIGQPLTLVEPVFGLLPVNLRGLVDTDLTWLCDGVPIPGVGDVTQFVPTQAQAGCVVVVRTVSTLLGLLPLQQETDPVQVSKIRSTIKLKKVRGKKVEVKVRPVAAHPTGKVLLKERKKTLKTIRLRTKHNGMRIVRLPKLRKGVHKIRAVYLGNKALTRSKSKRIRIVIR
jgi:large repetitive protein